MFFSANKLFTIGKFAKLHEINKKTLMWYDEIGLLKPAVIKENGYRYYTYQQSYLLEIILMLRELGVSIPEIRGFLENRTVLSLKKLFAEKISAIEETIRHLQAVQKTMEKKHQDMDILSNLDLSEIQIVERAEPRYLGIVDVSQAKSMEEEMDLAVAGAKKYHLHRLYETSYGAMLSIENMDKGNFNSYTALYLELPEQERDKALHVQPAGKYLRAFCKGDGEQLAIRYREIMAYAEERGITFYDFSYEQGLNEIVLDSLDNYITLIEIPVKF